jgi:hypothetical protein
LSEKRERMGQLHVATYHHMSKKIGEQQHFEEGDTSLWQVKIRMINTISEITVKLV